MQQSHKPDSLLRKNSTWISKRVDLHKLEKKRTNRPNIAQFRVVSFIRAEKTSSIIITITIIIIIVYILKKIEHSVRRDG